MKFISMLCFCLFSASLYAASPVLDPSSSVPADNATGVAVDANIILDFDIDVVNFSPSAVILLYEEGGSLVEFFQADGPFSFLGSEGGSGSIESDKITLNPGSDFVLGSGYYIIIPEDSAIIDRSIETQPSEGDFVIPVTLPTTYNFSTAAGAIRAVPATSIWGLGMLVVMMGWLGMRRRRKS